MYYYRARYYNPSIGRFMQADPWGTVPDGGTANPFKPQDQYEAGFNLYRYVQNNPTNIVDPLGLECRYVCYIMGLPAAAWGYITGECFYMCNVFCYDKKCREWKWKGITFIHGRSNLGYCPGRVIIYPPGDWT